MHGRPVIYIPARNHNVNDRDIDELTKFIVYCLVIGQFLMACNTIDLFLRKMHVTDASKKWLIICV